MDSRPINTKPHIEWKHADGPLLVCSDGYLHWLSVHERMMLRFGFTTIDLLDRKYNRSEQCKP